MNINDECTVYLTQHGKQVLDEYRSRLEHKTNTDLKEILSYGQDGLFTSPLWKIMNIFGKQLYNGAKQTFQNNEILIWNDDEEA